MHKIGTCDACGRGHVEYQKESDRPLTCADCRDRWGTTEHALDRYREFYPDSYWPEMRRALGESTKADRRTVHPIIGRAGVRDSDSGEFLVHPDRTGVFVVRNRLVLTFIRFYGVKQRETARRLWGGGIDYDPRCGPPPDETPITMTNGVARMLGGRINARIWFSVAKPIDNSGWFAERNGELVPADRVYIHNGRPLCVLDGHSTFAHKAPEPRPSAKFTGRRAPLGTCLVGNVIDLRVTDAVVAMYRSSGANMTCAKAARIAVAAGKWAHDGTCYQVTVPDRVLLVVERSPGEWWIASRLPPTCTSEEGAAIRMLVDAGWSVHPPPWDKVEG